MAGLRKLAGSNHAPWTRTTLSRDWCRLLRLHINNLLLGKGMQPGYWGVPSLKAERDMRNTYIGLGAAAAIIVVIFIISRLIPHPQVAQQQPQAPAGPSPQEVAAQAAQVGSGFNGDTQIGQWSLKCTPEAKPAPSPASQQGGDSTTLNADGSSAAPAAAPAKKPAGLELGRCRATLIVHPRDNPKVVALAAVVRLVKDTSKDRIALILHVPPLTKVGGKAIVALTEKEVIGLPVLSCDKGQCVALGVLEQNVYQAIVARPGVAIVVPILVGKSTGKRMVVPLSMVGLSQTIDAMKRAS